jgi:oligosaccharyltransferase complex subunit delta (ribophorin II)
VAFLDAALFHGGIGAVLALYALYWLRLTLLQTLPTLGALLLFSTVFGFRNLSNLANSK